MELMVFLFSLSISDCSSLSTHDCSLIASPSPPPFPSWELSWTGSTPRLWLPLLFIFHIRKELALPISRDSFFLICRRCIPTFYRKESSLVLFPCSPYLRKPSTVPPFLFSLLPTKATPWRRRRDLSPSLPSPSTLTSFPPPLFLLLIRRVVTTSFFSC